MGHLPTGFFWRRTIGNTVAVEKAGVLSSREDEVAKYGKRYPLDWDVRISNRSAQNVFIVGAFQVSLPFGGPACHSVGLDPLGRSYYERMLYSESKPQALPHRTRFALS
jgi:hypothetical protein